MTITYKCPKCGHQHIVEADNKTDCEKGIDSTEIVVKTSQTYGVNARTARICTRSVLIQFRL